MHAGDAGWWQDMDLWGEDVIIHRRALRSYYRVNDPSTKEGKRMRSAFGTVRKKRNCTVAHMREWPVCERLIKLTEPLLLC